MKPNQAEGEFSAPHTHNAVPKPPKGKDEYSGHLPQVDYYFIYVIYFNAKFLDYI